MNENEDMPHCRLYMIGYKPVPSCIVAVRETWQEAEDEVQRLNDAIQKPGRTFKVFSALVHFERGRRI